MSTTLATMTQPVAVATLPDNDTVRDLPKTLTRSTTTNDVHGPIGHRRRHTKKLSLNFPIMVPTNHDSMPHSQSPIPHSASLSSITQSPGVSSPYRMGTGTPTRAIPSPEDLADGGILSEGPDFLTLIAGQERRVMELKEELQKAEGELTGLKRQWAMFEAKKKQIEMRTKTVRMGAVSRDATPNSAEGEEAERSRRREARERERKLRELAMKEAQGDHSRSESNGGKNKGGRVFAGRHTRTLSLLQSTGDQTPKGNRPKSNTQSSEPNVQPPASATSTMSTFSDEIENELRRQTKQSLSRQPTLQELIASSATGAAQLNFGRTYKDLAMHGRKSLPPGTDVFVKQGKQVYDGVSAGFWNFVEDIRQATVGDEAVQEQQRADLRREVRKAKSNKKLRAAAGGGEHDCERHGNGNGKADGGGRKGTGGVGDEHKPEKDRFWEEFGLETPKPARQGKGVGTSPAPGAVAGGKENRALTTAVKDHESKSSTDSKCPPSLLADLMDVNEDDEAWDSWLGDSPVAQRQAEAERRVKVRNPSEDGSEGSEESVGETRRVFEKKTAQPMEATWAELTS